jgi:NAD(P)-dependent dehydrogenase (short-subunit alcohol dehydrogenase family)
MLAIVTGGSGALGSAVARALSKRGHAIVLADSPRAKERLDPLVKELGRAAACAADLATADGWTAVMRAAESLGEPPSLAALVAGGWKGGKALHESDDETWTAMMSSNVDTVHRAFRALLPGMVERKHGSIVVVGSRNVERPWTGAKSAAYTASKAAAVALAQATAAEVLDHGVRINAVLPSTMDTPANRASMPKVDPAKWVTTESAAAVIAFLLSDEARDISGAALPVYGRA